MPRLKTKKNVMITTGDPLVGKIVLLKLKMIEINRMKDELERDDSLFWQEIINISIPPSGMHRITNIFFNPDLKKVEIIYDNIPNK